MPDLLYEIGVEEIPASYIPPALEQLRTTLEKELDAAQIAHGEIKATGTPRRLVVWAKDVADRQPDADEEVSGPPVRAAFDGDGNPTKAAQGFARSQGVTVDDIQRVDTPKGEYCMIQVHRVGRPTAELLAEILPPMTQKIASPKSMVWPGSKGSFSRPVRSLTAFLGDDALKFSAFGLDSGTSVESHPILDPGRFEITSADFDAYSAALREHKIVVDMDEREQYIRDRIAEELKPFGSALTEEWLLEEVRNLAQYPSVTLGSFDEEFLEVPASAVEAAMMEHQRYFPVLDADGKLCPNFIVVSDRGPEPDNVVRVGNEQVLRARLADARFFYHVDCKTKLEDRIDGLKGVQYLRGLGTYHDKVGRLEKLTVTVAKAFGMDNEVTAHAQRAATLCKADLITEMVNEFSKLQGEVGRIYALSDGEPQGVANAILEHYMPKSADGKLPETQAGIILSLADKLDNLTACFALNLVPTGSADPYALRRQAHALVRMILESGKGIDLRSLLSAALNLLPEPHCNATGAVDKLLDFIKDRLFQMTLDDGAPHDLIHAALAVGWEDVADFKARVTALRTLSTDECWPTLVAAVERVTNISKAASDNVELDAALYAEEPERELGKVYADESASITALFDGGDYEGGSRKFAEIFAAPLHNFFDKVFVNVDDEKVRANRLALLRAISRLYTARMADLSKIVTGVTA
jgi:glycyl-tRNA synthetase beta chain